MKTTKKIELAAVMAALVVYGLLFLKSWLMGTEAIIEFIIISLSSVLVAVSLIAVYYTNRS